MHDARGRPAGTSIEPGHDGTPGSLAPVPREADLARRWAAQTLGESAPRTVTGDEVRVLFPGRPGGRSGPDFLDAVIQVGALPATVGDVEFHLDSRDFVGHGHADDPAYARVVLHVVANHSGESATALPGGGLAPILAVPAAAPDLPPLCEPCTSAPARLSTERVRQTVREAGLWRLRCKAERLGERIERDGPAQALYTAIGAALGQRANASAFTHLTAALPWSSLSEGLGAFGQKGRIGVYTRRLLHAGGFDGSLLGPAPALPWVIGGGRPAAHPARRLHAFAIILARLACPDLVAGGIATIDQALACGPRDLLRELRVDAPHGPAYCGTARAVEVAVNAMLPWAAAMAEFRGFGEQADAVLWLADRLPAGESYGVTGHLDRNLRDTRGRRLLTTALLRQGELALTGEWCRRGGCGRCPLS